MARIVARPAHVEWASVVTMSQENVSVLQDERAQIVTKVRMGSIPALLGDLAMSCIHLPYSAE